LLCRLISPCIFTGNIDPTNEKVKSAICTYLGGLKSKTGVEKFTDNNIRKPKGKVDNHFGKEMQVKKASNFVIYNAPMPFSMTNRTLMTAIGNILTIRYTESIREKEGGSYGVGVRGGMSNTPIDEATLLMQFDCDPLKQEHLISIIYSEINDIIAKGPRADDLQKVKENMLKKYKEDVELNSWWSGALSRYYKDKLNLVSDYKPAVDALTPGAIQNSLKKLVSQGNVLEVVMKPAE
jgi:zinc protease